MKSSTPTWRTADTFWASPPIAPTVPSRAIVPVTATSAAGEVALRELVDQRERERQAGRRAADAPVSMSISNGSSTLAGSNGRKPTIVRVGSSGEAISSTSTGPPSRAGPVDLHLDGVAWLRVGELGDEVVDVASVDAVGHEEHVAELEHVVGRRKRRALDLARLEADEVGHDDVAGRMRHRRIQRLQGDELGDLRDVPIICRLICRRWSASGGRTSRTR